MAFKSFLWILWHLHLFLHFYNLYVWKKVVNVLFQGRTNERLIQNAVKGGTCFGVSVQFLNQIFQALISTLINACFLLIQFPNIITVFNSDDSHCVYKPAINYELLSNELY